jgi:hypothetical protein
MSSLSGSRSKLSNLIVAESNTVINLPAGNTIEGCNALLNSASNEILILQGMVRYLLSLSPGVKKVPTKWEKSRKGCKRYGV